MNKSFIQEISEKIKGHIDSSIKEELCCHFSQTLDNEQCGETINIKEYRNPYTCQKVYGLKTKNYSLTEIAYALENEDNDVFNAMKQILPRLTEKEWEAFTRLTTLIYCDLEKGIS